MARFDWLGTLRSWAVASFRYDVEARVNRAADPRPRRKFWKPA